MEVRTPVRPARSPFTHGFSRRSFRTVQSKLADIPQGIHAQSNKRRAWAGANFCVAAWVRGGHTAHWIVSRLAGTSRAAMCLKFTVRSN